MDSVQNRRETEQGASKGEVEGPLGLSYSKIKNWRFCRQAYHYAHNLRIEPKKKPKPLQLGGSVHHCLEAYRAGKNWKQVLQEITEEYNKLLDEEKEHYGNIPQETETIVENYIEHYKEQDRGYIFRTVEHELGPYELTTGVVISVTPDAIVEDTAGRLWLLEMKTGKRLPTEDFHMWNLQTLIYAWAVRKAGYPVVGILWDHIRTKLPTEPRLLNNGSMSRRKNIDTTWGTYKRCLLEARLDPRDYSDMEELLKDKKDFFTRTKVRIKEIMMEKVINDVRISAGEIRDLQGHITRDISQFKCPKCMYSSLCDAALNGGDEQFIIDREYVPKRRKKYGRDTEESNPSA